MTPDRNLGAELVSKEKESLAKRKAMMSGDDELAVIEHARKLLERQSIEEDLSVLPKVGMEDIPAIKAFPYTDAVTHKGVKLTAQKAGTNGITYHQIVRQLPDLTEDQVRLVPLYSQLLTEIGSAGRDYLATQHLQHSMTGGISAFASVRAEMDNCENYKGYFTLSSRTLNRQVPNMISLLRDTALTPNFAEPERLRDLVGQLRIRRMSNIAGNGHQYAMSAAAASLRPVSALNDLLTGIPGIMQLKKIDEALKDPAQLAVFTQSLVALHERMLTHDPEFLLISEAEYLAEFSDSVASLWADPEVTDGGILTIAEAKAGRPRAYVVTTQVNYCATAFATVPEQHEDSAALSVLAGVLRNNFLHSEIREKGGAYGGGAGHDATNGVFRFYSYRDPRLAKTFETFEQSIAWVQTADITDAMLEESILGIISSVDAPGSPAGEIRQAFHHGLFGRDASHRSGLRQSYLKIRSEDIKRVAAKYLTAGASRALVTSENRLGEVSNDFDIIRVTSGEGAGEGAGELAGESADT